MVVRPKLGRVDPPLSRHAEVEHHRVAAVGVDQPVFPAPAEAGHPGAGQPLAEVVGKAAPQIGPAKLDALDAAAEQHLLQPADGGFDFGKLGHPRHMANVPAAS